MSYNTVWVSLIWKAWDQICVLNLIFVKCHHIRIHEMRQVEDGTQVYTQTFMFHVRLTCTACGSAPHEDSPEVTCYSVFSTSVLTHQVAWAWLWDSPLVVSGWFSETLEFWYLEFSGFPKGKAYLMYLVRVKWEIKCTWAESESNQALPQRKGRCLWTQGAWRTGIIFAMCFVWFWFLKQGLSL